MKLLRQLKDEGLKEKFTTRHQPQDFHLFFHDSFQYPSQGQLKLVHLNLHYYFGIYRKNQASQASLIVFTHQIEFA